MISHVLINPNQTCTDIPSSLLEAVSAALEVSAAVEVSADAKICVTNR